MSAILYNSKTLKNVTYMTCFLTENKNNKMTTELNMLIEWRNVSPWSIKFGYCLHNNIFH